jgi:hypothetical protein
MESLVYVSSYKAVILAMYLYRKDKNIKAITCNEEISNYLKKVHINVIFLSFPKFNYKNILSLLNLRNYLREEIASLNNKFKDVWFSHNAFDCFGFFIIKELIIGKNGKKYFVDLDPVRQHYHISMTFQNASYIKDLRTLYRHLIFRIIFDLKKLIILETPHSVLGIDNRYISYINAEIIKLSVLEMLKFLGPKKDRKNKILFLTDPYFTKNCEKDCESLLFYLKDYKDFIDIKPHPFEAGLSVFKNYNIINKSVPVELIIQNYSTVLGFGSAAMKVSSDLNIKTISLLNFLPKSKHTLRLKQFINNGNECFLFYPKNFIELSAILNS